MLELGGPVYRGVLVDLDGTLLASHGRASDRTRRAIAAAQARGVPVMVVTGRSVGSAWRAVDDLDLETPMLCYNGGALFCPRQRELLWRRTLERDLCRRLIDDLVAEGLDFFVNAGDDKLCLAPRDADAARALATLEGVRIVTSTGELVPARGAERITILAPDAQVAALHARLDETHGRGIYLERFRLAALPSHRDSTSHVCDIHPPSRGKAEALAWFEEERSIPREDLVAIGDGLNDLAMIRGAGLGLAMANAHPEVLAAAARILPHHDEDGVAVFLEELVG